MDTDDNIKSESTTVSTVVTDTAKHSGARTRPTGHQGGRRGRDRNKQQDEPKQYEEVTINVDRVARVVKGGRRFRFKALVVVGDRINKVGVGVAKGADVQVAIAKAVEVAKKHMIVVPIANGTIPHDIEVKIAGAHVLLKPRLLVPELLLAELFVRLLVRLALKTCFQNHLVQQTKSTLLTLQLIH